MPPIDFANPDIKTVTPEVESFLALATEEEREILEEFAFGTSMKEYVSLLTSEESLLENLDEIVKSIMDDTFPMISVESSQYEEIRNEVYKRQKEDMLYAPERRARKDIGILVGFIKKHGSLEWIRKLIEAGTDIPVTADEYHALWHITNLNRVQRHDSRETDSGRVGISITLYPLKKYEDGKFLVLQDVYGNITRPFNGSTLTSGISNDKEITLRVIDPSEFRE